MKILVLLLLLVGLNCPPTFRSQKPEKPQRTETPETPHLAFVTEYIRELAAIEDIRASGEKELKKGKQDEVLSTAIYTSTRMQLELRSDVKMLSDMRLKDPFDFLLPDITAFYEQKIELHQKLIDIASAILAGPKPGVDYGKQIAEMPKIRASLDDIDHTLFQAAPTIFATLIDPKPDSKNHASHLIVTKAEKKKLIEDLDLYFGTKLDQKDQNYTVGTASVLKGYFLKDFKCADEPWE
jgi:hypothetical protein